MATDIVCVAERQVKGDWYAVDGLAPFAERNYAVFAFLADVHNTAGVTPIPRRSGLPVDASPGTLTDFYSAGEVVHGITVVEVADLLAFPYERTFENRRILAADGRGFASAPIGGGRQTTYREFLGRVYFRHLEALKAVNADRLVLWFEDLPRPVLVEPTLADTLTIEMPERLSETSIQRSGATATANARALTETALQRGLSATAVFRALGVA